MLHLMALPFEFWLMVFRWCSYSCMMRKWAIIVLLWRSRPRTDGGLEVDCLALVIIAVPDLEIKWQVLYRRGAAGACSAKVGMSTQDWWQRGAGQRCSQCAMHLKLIGEITNNLSVVPDPLLCSVHSVKFCMHCLTFPMLEQLQRRLLGNYRRISQNESLKDRYILFSCAAQQCGHRFFFFLLNNVFPSPECGSNTPRSWVYKIASYGVVPLASMPISFPSLSSFGLLNIPVGEEQY